MCTLYYWGWGTGFRFWTGKIPTRELGVVYVLSVRACPGDFVMLIAKILVYSSTTYELVVHGSTQIYVHVGTVPCCM